ncbi:hypothetical protein AVDCRST_MAG92-1638 [uncultured Coleofasciculus sp.]|uniref:Uncharacterized protein n=1 Tax=uncultured Coleofasciculus sp. TaxID=1267456 RepID=A0A6J4I5N5_9CYAN|nr:hypothetical protein AVDCRST_MAG92-1638 [uncultured Coleofasciculus sp.]
MRSRSIPKVYRFYRNVINRLLLEKTLTSNSPKRDRFCENCIRLHSRRTAHLSQ